MNPEQALQVLDQAVAMVNLNRQGHIAIQQALEVLVKFVKDSPQGVPSIEQD